MMNTRVVILAAGQGKRMASSIPKPLMPISGRPMIMHLIENVQKSGIDARPIVVVAPDSLALFKKTLGDICDFAIQKEQLGTGHAVMSARQELRTAKRVIVLYGDHPFIPAETLRALVSLHDENPEAIAMLTCKVPSFVAPYDVFASWGKIIRNASGSVLTIREIKDCSIDERQVREVNSGIYAFPASWMWRQLPRLTTKNAGGEYYLTELITLACNEDVGIITASADPLDVMGVNTPDELVAAETIFNNKAH